MSRVVSTQETLNLPISGFDNTRYSYASASGNANAFADADSTTYGTINLKTGSSAETYIFYKFDTSAIPDGATIESVSCRAKVYISSTSTQYITTRQAQMYTGSTAKGSASTVSNSTTAFTLTVGTWTLEELRDAYIRIYAKRATRNTSTTYYFRVYGATLTITYSFQGVMYTVTAESQVEGVTAEPASEEYLGGKAVEVTIDGALGEAVVTDNGADVTSQLVLAPNTGSSAKTPASYTTSGSISGTNYQGAVGNGHTRSASGNDYCSSSGSTAYINYAFDFADLPTDVDEFAVSVQANGHCESTTNSSEVARLQLYSGSTAKGSAVSYTSTSNTVVTINGGTWTRAELQNAILRFTIGYYGGQMCGATWTVTYEREGTTYVYTIASIADDHTILVMIPSSGGLYLKRDGAWVRVSKVWRKESGVWAEREAAEVLEEGTKYIKV